MGLTSGRECDIRVRAHGRGRARERVLGVLGVRMGRTLRERAVEAFVRRAGTRTRVACDRSRTSILWQLRAYVRRLGMVKGTTKLQLING